MIKRFKRERGSNKWLWLVLVVIGCILTIPAIALRNNGASAQIAGSALTASPAHVPTAKEIKARSEYWSSKQGFAHGISAGAFTNAIAQINDDESSGSTRKLASADVTAADSWDFLGPDPISLLTLFAPGVVFGPPHSGAGAFTSVAVDPQSGDIFAGSANGGLYLSADGGTTFSQIFNGQPSQAIGAIAIDTTTSPSTVYVGTGNPNGNLDDYYGAGVFRSPDLGNTWTQIMPASFADGAVAVSKIALDPANHIIFVGATWGSSASRADASIIESDFSQAGLWESSDDGTTWTQYAPSALGNCYFISTTQPCPVDDVEIDPALNGSNPASHNVYVAVDGIEGNSTNSGGIFRSTNEGATFTSFGISSLSRDSIAIGQPTGSNGPAGVAYFMIGDTSGEAFINFWYSPDGNTLHQETVPSFSSGGFTFDGINPNNQANSFYSQTLTVLPGTSNTVFFGGVGIYKGVNTGNTMNWQPIVNTTSGGAAANQHAFAYDAATAQMLLADDGGMYSFNPASSSNVTFTSLNTTIDTTLVQSVGPNPTNNSLLIAGFQGAGTQQYQAGTWAFPTSEAGDGGFAMYDPTDPNYAYHTSSNANWDAGTTNLSDIYFAFSKNANSTTSPATWSSATPSKNLIAAMNGAGDPGAAFYPPVAVAPTTSHRVYFGGHAVYVSNDGGTTWVLQANYDLTDGCLDGTCALQDIEPVSQTNGWALSMADSLLLSDQFVLSNTTTLNLDTTNNNPGGTWSTAPTQALASLVPAFSTQATGIAVDHNNPNTAYLSLSGFYGGTAGTGVGHIYKTTDFGNTWAEADGGTAQSNPPSTALPDVPVLRVLVDSADTTGGTVYAATDIGVFQSLDGGSTWASFNLGTLQAIPVFDIEENQNTPPAIFIGTHGKGVFQLIPATPTPTPTATISPTPTPTPTSGASPTPVPGTLTVSPASITFPATVFGSSGATSPPKPITVSNPKKGKNPVSITITGLNLASDSSGTYNLLNNGCAATPVLAPNQKCTITVTYTPNGTGKSAGSLTVDNNGTTPKNVKLAGTGTLTNLTAAPKSLKFPKTPVSTASAPSSVTIQNKSGAAIGISGPPIFAGKFPGDYSIQANTCGSSVAANSTCSVAVIFTPQAKGGRPATMTIVGTTKSPLKITLSGTGQ